MNFVLSKKNERKRGVMSPIQKYKFLQNVKNNNEKIILLKKKAQEAQEAQENPKIEEVCETENIEENPKIEEVCETENISLINNNTNDYSDTLYEDNIKPFVPFDQKDSLNKLTILINEILDRIEPEELFDYKLVIKDEEFLNFEETQPINPLNIEYNIFSPEKLDKNDTPIQEILPHPLINNEPNNEPKKLIFNMDKIKNIVEKKNEKIEITNNDLLLKMNNVVSKVNKKLETEMNKDLFNFSEIMASKSARKNILNLICLSILNKIENLFS